MLLNWRCALPALSGEQWVWVGLLAVGYRLAWMLLKRTCCHVIGTELCMAYFLSTAYSNK
jgi:hypothetical protein